MSYQLDFDELLRWEDAKSAPRTPVDHPPIEIEDIPINPEAKAEKVVVKTETKPKRVARKVSATPKATPPAPTLFSEVAREAGLEAVIYRDQNRIYGETVMHRIRTGQKVY